MDLKFYIKAGEHELGSVWKRKIEKDRYLKGRDGDMWCSPFQCEECWFINLMKRYPNNSRVDRRILDYARRVNLDIFWSRESKTVEGTLTQLRKIKRLSEDLVMGEVELKRGPWPVSDDMGFQLAIIMLRASQEKGRHSEDHLQFDTIRKLRSTLSNIYENSFEGNIKTLVFRGDKGRSYKLSTSGTESKLFTKFIQGCELRMGRDVRSDKALHYKILHQIIRNFESELMDYDVPWERKRILILTGGYLMLCFGCSLRGNEGFYLERKSENYCCFCIQ